MTLLPSDRGGDDDSGAAPRPALPGGPIYLRHFFRYIFVGGLISVCSWITPRMEVEIPRQLGK